MVNLKDVITIASQNCKLNKYHQGVIKSIPKRKKIKMYQVKQHNKVNNVLTLEISSR